MRSMWFYPIYCVRSLPPLRCSIKIRILIQVSTLRCPLLSGRISSIHIFDDDGLRDLLSRTLHVIRQRGQTKPVQRRALFFFIRGIIRDLLDRRSAKGNHNTPHIRARQVSCLGEDNYWPPDKDKNYHKTQKEQKPSEKENPLEHRMRKSQGKKNKRDQEWPPFAIPRRQGSGGQAARQVRLRVSLRRGRQQTANSSRSPFF